MAIPIARVHLKMAHAVLPGLLPTPPPKCVAAVLPAPRSAAILLGPPLLPKPSRADAAERWDAHKIKPDGSLASSASSSSCGQRSSVDGKNSSPGRASSCERWDISKKSVASSSSGTSTTISSISRADSEERWDAHKKPVSPVASPPSSSASSNTWRPKSRAYNSMELWDAHKKPTKEERVDEHDDDGKSSTASNDMEVDMQLAPQPPLAFFAGPGFIASPEPSLLPMPSSFMIRVA